jgi:hypothetical protein
MHAKGRGGGAAGFALCCRCWGQGGRKKQQQGHSRLPPSSSWVGLGPYGQKSESGIERRRGRGALGGMQEWWGCKKKRSKRERIDAETEEDKAGGKGCCCSCYYINTNYFFPTARCLPVCTLQVAGPSGGPGLWELLMSLGNCRPAGNIQRRFISAVYTGYFTCVWLYV